MEEEAKRYAPVLERAIELLGSDDGLKMGDALGRAAKELDIPVPEEMQERILIILFQVMTQRKIPGLPEA